MAMTKTWALILVHVTMILLIVVASVGLDIVGAKDDAVVAAILFIGCGGAFAISEVVARYAKRDERQPQ